MESILIISGSEKSFDFFKDMLIPDFCNEFAAVKTGGEARRLLLERDFDLCIINSPLRDETGENLACHAASKGNSQVILLVKYEFYEEMSANVEDSGVITLSKPINRDLLWNTLKLARAAHKRIRKLQAENTKLVQKIEDIRIVDRAKYILISYLKMTEEDAHRYIEKKAMDSRMTRRAVAEEILKIYEN